MFVDLLLVGTPMAASKVPVDPSQPLLALLQANPLARPAVETSGASRRKGLGRRLASGHSASLLRAAALLLQGLVAGVARGRLLGACSPNRCCWHRRRRPTAFLRPSHGLAPARPPASPGCCSVSSTQVAIGESEAILGSRTAAACTFSCD